MERNGASANSSRPGSAREHPASELSGAVRPGQPPPRAGEPPRQEISAHTDAAAAFGPGVVFRHQVLGWFITALTCGLWAFPSSLDCKPLQGETSL